MPCSRFRALRPAYALSRRTFLLGGSLVLCSEVSLAEEIDRRVARTHQIPTPGSPIQTGVGTIDVFGSMDQVLDVLLDYRKYHTILPRLETSRVVGKRKGSTDVYLRAPILRGLAHVWGLARFSPPRRRPSGGREIVGTLVKGNLDGWHGRWLLHPCGKRTILTMEMFIDLKIPVPAKLVASELAWAAGKGVTAVRDMVECGESGVKAD